MMRKSMVLIVSILIIAMLGVSVYAFNEFFAWERPISLKIVAPELNVYFDEMCTDPVPEQGIDLGKISVGARGKGFTLYVRNEGEDYLWLTWYSTVESETGGKIYEHWWIPEIGHVVEDAGIAPGEIHETQYVIWVLADCPVENYSWTLFLGVKD